MFQYEVPIEALFLCFQHCRLVSPTPLYIQATKSANLSKTFWLYMEGIPDSHGSGGGLCQAEMTCA